jgi:hypothetical protein
MDAQQATTAERSQSAVSRIFISPNGDSSYHGLTSTLFDDAPTDRRGQCRSKDSQIPAEHIRKQLMGEAAYQRKLFHPKFGSRSNHKKVNWSF